MAPASCHHQREIRIYINRWRLLKCWRNNTRKEKMSDRLVIYSIVRMSCCLSMQVQSWGLVFSFKVILFFNIRVTCNWWRANSTHALVKETTEVICVSKTHRTEISHFLFCLPVCLWRCCSVSPLCITCLCLSVCLRLSHTVSASVDEVVRVTLNTKCPSVPSMLTPKLSHS